jgi:colanic acid/amylovoran biosynthesis protein
MNKRIASPKRIIISHVYSSDNKGDAALTSVLIRDLKRKFKDATITILTLDAIAADEYFERVPKQPSFMSYALNKYHNPVVKLAYMIFMINSTLLWAAWYRLAEAYVYLPKHLREVAALYQDADLIVPVGGGYMRSRKGVMHRFNIPLLLHPLLLGYLLGKPTVLYAQSVGPFQNKFEKALVAFVLNRMTLIMLREDTSVRLLASIGVTRNVIRTVDSGFLLSSRKKIDLRKAYCIPPASLLVGVTVRYWLTGKAQQRYEQAVAQALDNVIGTLHAHVVFIPQVTANKGDDDRIVSRRVRDIMQHTSAITLVSDTPDHHHIKALYDNLDILLGTRFHSVIFSLTSHVPVLAIEYEHKTSGIMRDLGLEDWVIKIEDVTTPRLTELLQKLIQERTDYQSQLAITMPIYIEQAQKSADFLAEHYYMAAQLYS